MTTEDVVPRCTVRLAGLLLLLLVLLLVWREAGGCVHSEDSSTGTEPLGAIFPGPEPLGAVSEMSALEREGEGGIR